MKTRVRPIVILPLIALLLSCALSILISRSHNGTDGQCREQVSYLAYMVRQCAGDIGELPDAKEGLRFLVHGWSYGGWSGPYLQESELLVDPWGLQIEYEKLDDTYAKVYSAGPDTIFGTDDDIVAFTIYAPAGP